MHQNYPQVQIQKSMTPLPQYTRKSRTNSRALTVKDRNGADFQRKHRSLSLSSISNAEQPNNTCATKANQENYHPDKRARPDKLAKHTRKALAIGNDN